MRIFRDKKGEEKSLGLIVSLVLAGVFLAFVIGLFVAVQTDFLNLKSFEQSGCWLTNTLQCSGGAFSFFGSLCFQETLEEPVDVEALAAIMRDTWWMYKQAKCDFGAAGDEVYPAYAFTVKEDIKLKDFISYITAHNRGRETGIVYSDFAYLEENTEGPTLCFDSKTIDDLTLKKGTIYYLRFFDDQLPHDQGDLLLISENAEFTLEDIQLEETTGKLYFFAIGWKEWLVEGLTGLEVAADPKSFCVNYGPGGVS